MSHPCESHPPGLIARGGGVRIDDPQVSCDDRLLTPPDPLIPRFEVGRAVHMAVTVDSMGREHGFSNGQMTNYGRKIVNSPRELTSSRRELASWNREIVIGQRGFSSARGET